MMCRAERDKIIVVQPEVIPFRQRVNVVDRKPVRVHSPQSSRQFREAGPASVTVTAFDLLPFELPPARAAEEVSGVIARLLCRLLRADFASEVDLSTVAAGFFQALSTSFT